MKLALATVAAPVAQTMASPQPLREHDPDTVKSCIDWFNNYDQNTCQEVVDAMGLTMDEFLAWNPSIKADCSPWLPVSYCVMTKEKYDVAQSASSDTPTATSTTTSTATSSLGPSPTAWSELGCYMDGNAASPVMQKRISPDGGDSSLNLPRCRDSCYRGGYRYAGVKNGNECWCSQNIIGDLAADDKECNLKCSGNSNMMCGGKDRLFAYGAQSRDGASPTSTTSATATKSSATATKSSATATKSSASATNNAASPAKAMSRRKELWLISSVAGAILSL